MMSSPKFWGAGGAHRTFQSLHRLARNRRQQTVVKWSILLLPSAKMPLISPINCILTYLARRMSSQLPTGVRDNAVCEMNGTLGFSKLPRYFFHKWYTIFLVWIVFSYQPRWLPKLSNAIRMSSTFIMFNKRWWQEIILNTLSPKLKSQVVKWILEVLVIIWCNSSLLRIILINCSRMEP